MSSLMGVKTALEAAAAKAVRTGSSRLLGEQPTVAETAIMKIDPMTLPIERVRCRLRDEVAKTSSFSLP